MRIRFRDGCITREEAEQGSYVFAAPPPEEIFAFEDAAEREAWAAEHGLGELLARALEGVKEAPTSPSVQDPDQYAPKQAVTEATERPQALADEFAAEGPGEVLGSVTLYGSPTYQDPLTDVPASTPNIVFITGGTNPLSIWSDSETVLLYDQPDYGPEKDNPLATVWPNSGLPDLWFQIQSIWLQP